MARPGLKASQRGRVRPTDRAPSLPPVRKAGEPVRWKDKKGTYHRDVGDGEHFEAVFDDRIYRVKTSELIFGAVAVAR
jgi:hypothetical protein